MAIQEKLYTVDDLWELDHASTSDGRYFYLIDGKLFEDEMPGRTHGRLAVKISFRLEMYNTMQNLGEVTVEVGYYPPDSRYTLLMPDVAYQRFVNLPNPPPEGYVPQMPDLAVEIQSPSDTLSKLRRKAQAYLENGTSLVWLVLPKRKGVEVCRLNEDSETERVFLGPDETLSGGDILPGFELAISVLFPPTQE